MIDFDEYDRRVDLAREAEAAGTSEAFGIMVPWKELALLLMWAKRGRTQGRPFNHDAAHRHAIEELQHQLTGQRPPFLKE